MFKFDIAVPLVSDPLFEQLKDGGLEFETYVLLKENVAIPSTIQLLKEHYDTFHAGKMEASRS